MLHHTGVEGTNLQWHLAQPRISSVRLCWCNTDNVQLRHHTKWVSRVCWVLLYYGKFSPRYSQQMPHPSPARSGFCCEFTRVLTFCHCYVPTCRLELGRPYYNEYSSALHISQELGQHQVIPTSLHNLHTNIHSHHMINTSAQSAAPSLVIKIWNSHSLPKFIKIKWHQDIKSLFFCILDVKTNLPSNKRPAVLLHYFPNNWYIWHMKEFNLHFVHSMWIKLQFNCVQIRLTPFWIQIPGYWYHKNNIWL